MVAVVRLAVFLAMVLFSLVSMATTYISLQDSVLPKPAIDIPLGVYGTWHCSVLALALSVAIGMMLFGLKLAIVDGHKRLNAIGMVGLFIVAFISITFNMDVLYRLADREFFLRYSVAQMKAPYVAYLADVQRELLQRKGELKRAVAEQEGELQSEIDGLRGAPEGYGSRARAEDYRLTILERTTSVELAAVDEALEATKRADQLLLAEQPLTVDEIGPLQDRIRVAVKDAGASTDLPVPEPVRLENPLFAVFSRLFDLSTVGFKEILILVFAILLDLSDVIGYSLVPNRPQKRRVGDGGIIEATPLFGQPEVVESRVPSSLDRLTLEEDVSLQEELIREGGALDPRVRRLGTGGNPLRK